jgi:CubicO group peptidase (beta-lactamase class C family)
LAGLQVLRAQFAPELESVLQGRADTAYFTSGHQAVFQVGGQGRNFVDRNVMEKFVGQHDREHNVPLSRKSQFRIGSNSKTFTTIAIFQLQSKGLMNIDHNVSDYLDSADIAALGLQAPQLVNGKYCPLLWDAATNDWQSQRECQSLTFRNLMAMRSGFINSFTCVYGATAWQRNFCNPDWDNFIWRGSIAETVATYINNPLSFAPGSKYDYSNGNQIFLSYFVQKYGGMKFELYLKQNILDPLGMRDTKLDVLNGELAAQLNFVSAYHDYTDLSTNPNGNSPFAYGKITTTEGHQGTLGGSGGLISTVWDMAKFYASLFVTKNASAVISQANLMSMMTPNGVSGDFVAVGLSLCETWGLGLFMYYNPCRVNGLPSCDCIDQGTGAPKPKPEGWNETDRISVFYQVRTLL